MEGAGERVARYSLGSQRSVRIASQDLHSARCDALVYVRTQRRELEDCCAWLAGAVARIQQDFSSDCLSLTDRSTGIEGTVTSIKTRRCLMSQSNQALVGSPTVSVHFDHSHRLYEPQARLTVRYSIDGIADDERVRAVELSVLWYTEGKGEEDLGVHFFERMTDRERLPPAVTVGSFVSSLPLSPLSYEGLIVKVRWCVRVRLFFTDGRDFVSEHVFELGEIPPAQTKPDGPAIVSV